MRLHRSHVCLLLGKTANTHSVDNTDKVEVVTLVPVYSDIQTVVDETELTADIELVLLLVSKFAILQIVDIQTVLLNVCERTEWSLALYNNH